MSLLLYFNELINIFKFSILISNMANNDKYILHKGKFAGEVFKHL